LLVPYSSFFYSEYGFFRIYFKIRGLPNAYEYSDTPLAEAVRESIKESKSWEDVKEWLTEAKRAETEFFERIKPDIDQISDLKQLKSEINFLKGVIRSLLSTREMKLESIICGYRNWNQEVNTEIEEMLKSNGFYCDE